MPGLSCNACNKEFVDDSEQKLHYKSEWHRYNLKRKVAGVPGVTEALFLAKQSAIAQEKNKSSEAPMIYSCGLCGKDYRSSKAHAEHLKSRSHILRVSQVTNQEDEEKAIIKPLQRRAPNKAVLKNKNKAVESEEDEDSDDEDVWVEVDPDEMLAEIASGSLSGLNVDGQASEEEADDMEEDDEFDDLDPSSCFMCDSEHDTIESCMVHMHKHHGFFIPDVEFLKDPEGLLTYLGLKVKRDFMCLYCNERCLPFSSLEAVRKHMVAKSHCKVHFGNDDEEDDAELEDFYDYTASYVDEDGQQLVLSGEGNAVELMGSELVITKRSKKGTMSKTIGSREYLRYYRQKPRPSPVFSGAISASLAARYRSMGLATVQSRERLVRLKVLREMNKHSVETMRSKMGMKSNVIRNLPKNCTY